MDRLRSMEMFVAVVELGSLTAAGNLFRTSPAAISKNVSFLEKRLGASLLSRTTRRQHLTEIGQKYFENCKNILQQIADAENGAEHMGTTPRGLLRVTAPVSFGSLDLPPLIAAYLAAYPEVNVQLSLTDRYVDIVEEGFDLAIRIGELDDSNFIAKKIANFEVVIAASPGYLAKAGHPTIPAELGKHHCLGLSSWKTKSGWDALQKTIHRSNRKFPRFESDNSYALLSAASNDVGTIMLPKNYWSQ